MRSYWLQQVSRDLLRVPCEIEIWQLSIQKRNAEKSEEREGGRAARDETITE
jgi:hypothetical protein